MKLTSLILLISIAGCTNLMGQVEDPAYNVMLKTLLAHSVKEVAVKDVPTETDNITLLDAREKDEYQVSHLKDAVLVGYNDFNLASVKNISKDEPIIVYCAVGYRSEKIAEKLKKAGYTNVSNLYGGIFEWVNEGRPVYDQLGKPTTKIHTYNSNWAIWVHKGEKVY